MTLSWRTTPVHLHLPRWRRSCPAAPDAVRGDGVEDADGAALQDATDRTAAHALAQWSARQHARTLTDLAGVPTEIAYT